MSAVTAGLFKVFAVCKIQVHIMSLRGQWSKSYFHVEVL